MTIDRVDNTPAVPQQAKAPVALSRPLGDIDQAWRMAQALSQSSLLPTALRNKASDVLVIIMYGQELGLSPMQAIQGIYVVNGRPQMSGQLWLAKVREAGHRVDVTDHTAEHCTVTITRGDTGEKHSETFTWADAERAKLTKKDTYVQWGKRMLLWRAVSNAATVICPEVAMGFGVEMPEAEPQQDAVESLTQAVDARTEPKADEPADVHDAEVVEDLAAADEQARQEVLALAAQHGAPADNPLHYEADEIAEGTL